MDPVEVRAALARASAAGAYFAVDEPSPGRDWRPLRVLLDDAAVLAERVGVARAFLEARTGEPVELRACASINELGVVARLVSPALATATLAGVVPALDPDRLLWSPVDGGPVPIAIEAVGGTRVRSADDAADALVDGVLTPAVGGLVEAYAGAFRLSRLVLWGNVASALAGAAGMLARAGLPLVIDPVDVVAALLSRAPLHGLGRYDHAFGRRWFVRHTCCLFYRVPAGGTCGDCVLVPDVARDDARSRQLGASAG